MKVICKRTGNICEMCKLGLIPDITKCKYREEVQEEEQKENSRATSAKLRAIVRMDPETGSY